MTSPADDLRARIAAAMAVRGDPPGALRVRHRYDWPETHTLWIEAPTGARHPLAMCVHHASEDEVCRRALTELWDRVYAERWAATDAGDEARVRMSDAALVALQSVGEGS